MTFTPKLDVLADAQRALWPALHDVPDGFVLYGGTALALRLGHRASMDFDFFTDRSLDHDALASLPFTRGATVLQQGPTARTITIANVKVSFFGGISFGRIEDSEITSDGVVRTASLRDLAGTKLKALLERVQAKDYLDIAALLSGGLPIEDVLGAAKALFGAAFNPSEARKALTYFKGGDLDTLDATVRALLVEASATDVAPSPLIRMSPRLVDVKS